MAATQERDVEMVLVTGAGASREFGVNGTKLPMMGEWSDALIDKLRTESFDYLAATLLDKDLDGPEFEKRLGAFLHRVQAFGLIEPLVPNTAFQIDQVRLSTVSEWYTQARHHLGRIIELIHESLYEKFSVQRVDVGAAQTAYGTLFAHLGVGAPSSLVVATTNYDVIAESVVSELGGLPDWGAAPQLTPGADAPLRVERLMDGFPRYVPVLHLHGRIGWYRRPDGSVYTSSAGLYRTQFGVPVVMLPDPDKSYDAEPVIFEMWRQFEQALSRAQRVFVLGHSLHDVPLVEALRQFVSPAERLAVGLLADPADSDKPHQSALPTMEILSRQLPKAAMIPVRFGVDTVISAGGIATWQQRLAEALDAQ